MITNLSTTLLTPGDTADVATLFQGLIQITLSNITTATIAFYWYDDTQWQPLLLYPIGSTTGVNQATANGTWQAYLPPKTPVRVSVISNGSGTPINVTVATSPAASPSATAGSTSSTGPAANNSPPSGNPVWVGGWDGTDLRALYTDSTGRMQVNLATALVNTIDSITAYPQANPIGGAAPVSGVSAASINATSVKVSAGTVYAVQLFNYNTTAARYFKFFDKSSAPNPAGGDLPCKVIAIPPASNNAGVVTPGGFVLSNSTAGIKFANGIAFAITGADANADATTVGANDVRWNFDYV